MSNAGTLTSPDGQVILGAGLQVAFAASTDPSLRGLDVTIGQVSASSYAGGATGVSGTAANFGDIEAPRADVTMAGQTVDQFGVINSSTSVALNGRIDLLADYGGTVLVNSVNGFNGITGLYSTASGEVAFGSGSLTQILPELDSTDTVVGTSLALSSQMNVQGRTIYLGPNAEILAPSAHLSLNAGEWLPTTTGYSFFNAAGQVYLDQGASIDVSGSEDVAASVTDNIISVQLLGTELADSPLQQDGPLRGQTVQVDIRQTGTYNGVNWIGTPIGDVSGYANLIPHTVGQLTTAGGTVAISAGGSVVMQPGSAINVSGGWTDYQGGVVQTTKVVSGGQIYDISQATPDRVYDGIYNGFSKTSSKYGLSQTYTGALQTDAGYEAGYVQGGNGGSLSITAPRHGARRCFPGPDRRRLPAADPRRAAGEDLRGRDPSCRRRSPSPGYRTRAAFHWLFRARMPPTRSTTIRSTRPRRRMSSSRTGLPARLRPAPLPPIPPPQRASAPVRPGGHGGALARPGQCGRLRRLHDRQQRRRDHRAGRRFTFDPAGRNRLRHRRADAGRLHRLQRGEPDLRRLDGRAGREPDLLGL